MRNPADVAHPSRWIPFVVPGKQTLTVYTVTRLVRHLMPRHALRRAAGLVVLALFARQTTTATWMQCSGAHLSAGMAVPAPAHQHGGPAPATPPSPHHSTDCNGMAPGGCCVVGSGCVSLLVVPTVSFASPAAVLRVVAGGTIAVPSLRDIAPADPPPRA